MPSIRDSSIRSRSQSRSQSMRRNAGILLIGILTAAASPGAVGAVASPYITEAPATEAPALAATEFVLPATETGHGKAKKDTNYYYIAGVYAVGFVSQCVFGGIFFYYGDRGRSGKGKGSDGLDHGLGRRLWPLGKRRCFGDPCTTLVPAPSHSLSLNAVAALRPPLA